MSIRHCAGLASLVGVLLLPGCHTERQRVGSGTYHVTNWHGVAPWLAEAVPETRDEIRNPRIPTNASPVSEMISSAEPNHMPTCEAADGHVGPSGPHALPRVTRSPGGRSVADSRSLAFRGLPELELSSSVSNATDSAWDRRGAAAARFVRKPGRGLPTFPPGGHSTAPGTSRVSAECDAKIEMWPYARSSEADGSKDVPPALLPDLRHARPVRLPPSPHNARSPEFPPEVSERTSGGIVITPRSRD